MKVDLKIEEEPTNKRCRACGGVIVHRNLVFKGIDTIELIHQVMQLAVIGFHCSGCGLGYHHTP